MNVTGPGSRSGSVQLNSSTTTPRTSARTDFGTQVRNGVAAGGGVAGSAIGVAAPFVPGAAVVSAAVSGAAGSVGGGGGAGFGGGGAGLAGGAGAIGGVNVGADGIPVGGSFLGAQQGGAAGGSTGNSGMDMLNATKNMQEMAQSFNLQYLQLQEKMQAENRSFSTVSNVMKTKHDTAKSSISNVR
jgi:hypothetical protein